MAKTNFGSERVVQAGLHEMADTLHEPGVDLCRGLFAIKCCAIGRVRAVCGFRTYVSGDRSLVSRDMGHSLLGWG